MNRLSLVAASALLAFGCGKDSSDNKAECQLEAIDLTGCDRSTLSVVQAEGVWNTNINLNDGYSGPSSIRFSPGDPLLVGLPMSTKQVTPDTFFLAADVAGSAEGSSVRYAFAGCKASGPGEVLGVVRVCGNGSTVSQGTFTARRVVRREGEAESDRVALLGQGALPRGAANGVAVANGYAYVIAGSEGMFVFDVKDPANPKLVSEHKLPTETYTSTLISGTTLYLGTYSKGIRICDLGKPEAPTCDKTVLADLSVRADNMVKDGNLLYVASPLPRADIVILDVTQPSAPTLVVRYTVEGASADLSEYPYALAVQDNRLYVSNWSYGLTVTDLAPLATTAKLPKLLGRFAGPSTSALAVGKLGDSTVVYQGSDAWGSSILALDATSPGSIVQRGELPLRPEATLGGMALSGTTLYVANYQDGLRVYDVSTLGTPKAAGYFNTWNETDAGRGKSYFDGLQGVHVADGLVYGWDTTRGLLIFRHTP
ncbi:MULTISPECIES: LVIVD repeat-containing protein [unclassified Corallococcus]|uniref:LVIVD repeat-containing protein n=1 Tax=unclassified Corallococcus TaxID=2685029 RepID=UPI001A8E463F|nr:MULTISPECIES: hypothetical protein [unclassified Corallococcus]MBN9683753.1 hypothetical protein [Corallococcus sp. NCSPR001]WAS84744.1 hypothetical protein O0N60_36430 [Corallococcus sp. NCRR]